MFEPIIKTDISMLPKTIETNLGDLEPFIADKCESAKALVVNPESIEECEMAEADATLLTKLQKRISTFRLTWTKQWQAPFEGVIAKCKDYERKLGDASADLKAKAKQGRDIVRDRKRESLAKIWGEQIRVRYGDVTFPHFDTFFAMMTDEGTTGCWTNRGKKDKQIVEEMIAELDRCSEALRSLMAMVAGDTPAIQQVAKDALGVHFDMTEAIGAVNSYKAQQERIKAAEDAARARLQAEQGKTATQQVAKPSEAPAPSPAVLVQDAPVTAKLETYNLAVTGTRADLVALRKWGEAHGISFKNLDR